MFKKCLNCNQNWETLSSFIADGNISFIGYQAHFDHARSGLFLFNHSCDTTLAIKLTEFEELMIGKLTVNKYTPKGHGCPGHCADSANLEECLNESCRGKSIRDLIQIVRSQSQWEKNFQKLLEFKNQNGHCDVPAAYLDQSFLDWISQQRINAQDIVFDRKRRLEKIGFIWNLTEEQKSA